ncbi:MAG: DUF664 domain-containing protein [Acidimicrobiales bacterium]
MNFPSPSGPALPSNEVFLMYLDYLRGRIVEKVTSLPLDALIVSVVPTDWTALELVKHLTYVEMRWLEWGFEGTSVDEPWGDHLGDRWFVGPEDTLDSLIGALRERGVVTEEIVRRHELDELGQPGPRWDGDEPATLERVLFHLVAEYARHLGHLDIYSELAEGQNGE